MFCAEFKPVSSEGSEISLLPLEDFISHVLSEAVVSHLFKLCPFLLSPCESLALLHHWPSDKLEQVFFVAVSETESMNSYMWKM